MMRRPNMVRLPAIDLQQLRFAVAAADCGSIRRAAESLTMRHSILSRSIRQFEHLIGVTVFDRSGTGVQPTPAGRDVLRAARVILEQVDLLVAAARSDRQGNTGRLAIGFCTSISSGKLRATIDKFRNSYPAIELSIVERPRSHLATMLRSGAADILIVDGDIASTDHSSCRLWNERVLMAMPEDHRLATRNTVIWSELRDETILFSRYDLGRELENLLASRIASADRPRIARHDVSRGTLDGLISMKLGIGLVLESDAGAGRTQLVYRELADGAGPASVAFSAYWRDGNCNPALKLFLRLLAQCYPSPP